MLFPGEGTLVATLLLTTVPMIFGSILGALAPLAGKFIANLFKNEDLGSLAGGAGGLLLQQLFGGSAPTAEDVLQDNPFLQGGFDRRDQAFQDFLARISQLEGSLQGLGESGEQDLRGLEGRAVDLSALLGDNAESIGVFDPTSFGEDFGFLSDTVGQFDDVDIGGAVEGRNALQFLSQLIPQRLDFSRGILDDQSRLNTGRLAATDLSPELQLSSLLIPGQQQFAANQGAQGQNLIDIILGRNRETDLLSLLEQLLSGQGGSIFGNPSDPVPPFQGGGE